MALAQLVATIRGVFNEGTARFGQAIIDWFSTHPDIIVQSVNWNRPDSTFTGDDQVLRVAYLQASGSAIGGQWEALFYQTNATLSAQDQFNAAFAVGSAPALIPMFVVDITDHERARTGQNALVVICLKTGEGPLGEVGYDRAAFIAQPIAAIASGATGDALILDGAGTTVSASMPVTNVGAVSWPQDERNYIVYDEQSGTYIGLPACAGAAAPWVAPASTTTTAFPCPTIFPEENPTTTFTVTTTTGTTTSSTSTTSSTTTSTTTTTTTTTTTSTTTTTTTGICPNPSVSGGSYSTPVLNGPTSPTCLNTGTDTHSEPGVPSGGTANCCYRLDITSEAILTIGSCTNPPHASIAVNAPFQGVRVACGGAFTSIAHQVDASGTFTDTVYVCGTNWTLELLTQGPGNCECDSSSSVIVNYSWTITNLGELC